MVSATDRKRLAVIAAFVCLLFSALIFRFYQIQILDSEKWTKAALSQHQMQIIEPFMRGSFFSNTSLKPGHPEDEQPFVVDMQHFHLMIDPDAVPETAKDVMADTLSKFLHRNVRSEFDRRTHYRKIAMWLDRETQGKILSWWNKFAKEHKIVKNALFFTSDYKRSHPFGSMLGAVLHTVQEQKDPKTAQGFPTGGLEMVFNNYLQGRQGKRLVTHSARHSIDAGELIEAPQNGADVYLTINHYLQAIAETELAKGVQAVNAKGGWAIMMDPKTGEILALAQTPTFDPANYSKYFNDPELQEYTRVKAVSDCFEPGSIFKPITLAVCLQANEELKRRGKKPLFSPDEKVPTSNGWFAGRSTPLKDGRPHNFLNMNLAIQKSSNVYMGRMAQRLIDSLGDVWYRNTLEEIFGFGQKTMIELPAENPGILPTPGKLHPNGKLEWSVPTPYSLAIGHNVLINSIQMVRAYGVFANGGILVQPHIVRKIVRKRADGSKEILLQPEIKMKRVLSSSIVDLIVRSLKYPTKEGGTSKRADIMGYTEAGKSGTAEKIIAGIYSKEHNISSFIGFAPAKNPRFVLMVSVDDPERKFIPGVGKQQVGGVCASPIFREIAARSLQYLGVEPDDPCGYPPGDPRRNSEKADWIAEVNALKKLYESWNG